MKKPSSSSSPRGDPDTVAHEATSRRAFELWQQRGRPAGQEAEIWMEAQHELESTHLGNAPAEDRDHNA